MSTSPVVETFIEFARQYSHAVRHSDRMSAQGNRDQIDDAISRKQEIERQVEEHLALIRTPPFLRRSVMTIPRLTLLAHAATCAGKHAASNYRTVGTDDGAVLARRFLYEVGGGHVGRAWARRRCRGALQRGRCGGRASFR
jgi:hypothetical protein